MQRFIRRCVKLLSVTGLVVTLLSLVAVVPTLSQSDPETGVNLIENPGFEEDNDDMLASWRTLGDVTAVSDDLHSGSRSLRVHAVGETAKIKSNWFTAPPHAHVDVSAWMKAEDVIDSGSYYKLRIAIVAYEEDRSTEIRHWDLVSTSGSFEWKKVQGSILVPPGTAYLQFEAQMNHTHGTFWIDDVVVRVEQPVPDVEHEHLVEPPLLPQPWSMRANGGEASFSEVVIVQPATDDRVNTSLTEFFEATGILHLVDTEPDSVPANALEVFIGDSSNPTIHSYFDKHFSNIDWQDLGSQGYFVSAIAQDGLTTVYIGANGAVGQFYGIQTLKQLIDPAAQTIYTIDIVDRPTLNYRGLVTGQHGFSEVETTYRNMAALKFNFLWVQGNFVDSKFWYEWREPFTDADRAEIQRVIEVAEKNFIELTLAIGPRGRNSKEATIYFSEENINLVVDKMKVLYNLGLRNFGLAYDDLHRFGQDMLSGTDLEHFDNIGEAHVYFAREVYHRLRAEHADITFTVVPMHYSRLSNRGDADEWYLRELAKLPQEIDLYTVMEYVEEAELMLEVSDRPSFVWDNYWAGFYWEQAPTYVAPLHRPPTFNNLNIRGYTFMSLTPLLQDAAMVSWKTAADYAWAPERYDAYRSFQLTAAQYQQHLSYTTQR